MSIPIQEQYKVMTPSGENLQFILIYRHLAGMVEPHKTYAPNWISMYWCKSFKKKTFTTRYIHEVKKKVFNLFRNGNV